ncbi:uncharacterized protein LOC124820098 [Vigna umbellata]|uniref:uncharacterized protein LOC124820098 n=1 Tax=Vigna umbellata TaxID=87088 RepID=UPI001F5F141F|nr:uncharacterized protein LOC124820098 [Vigna umbellata]
MADLQQGDQPSSSKAMERKTIEKTRRIHMKNLCSQLSSLLPNNNNPRVCLSLLQGIMGLGVWEKEMKKVEALSRVDQIDEAINHIKNLETKVKMAEKHRESLRERKRSRSGCSSSFEATKLRFMKWVLATNHSDNIEVKTLHSSLSSATSSLHVLNAEIQQSYNLGTAVLIERLKIFVNGHG